MLVHSALILTCLSHCLSELILNTDTKVATADYFASHYQPYSYQSLHIVLVNQFKPNCQPVLPPTPISAGQESLVVVDSANAFTNPQFCHDFRRVADRVQTAWTTSGQRPFTAMLFVNSDDKRRGHSGGPRRNYMSDSIVLPDGAPSFVTAFANNAQSRRLLDAMGNKTDSMVMSFTQDVGPWNRMYWGGWFRASVWTLTAICIGALVLAVYRIVQTWRLGLFTWSYMPHVVYMLCMGTVVGLVPLMYIRLQSAPYYLVNTVVSSMSYMCLVMVMILWINRLATLGIRVYAHKFISVLYLAVGFTLVNMTVYIATFMFPTKSAQVVLVVFGILHNLQVLMLCGISAVFLLASMQFLYQVSTFHQQLSHSAKSNLYRLTLLSIVAGIVFGISAGSQFVRTSHGLDVNKPRAVFIYYLGGFVRKTIRLVSVLVLLPLGTVQEKEGGEKV